MIFPIGDTQVVGGCRPVVSYAFIAINVLIFLYEFSLGSEGAAVFINTYGTIPVEILVGQDYFTLLTSMFLHGGWMHLIGNMLFLWVFGDNIEATIGNVQFVVFYLAGGLVASAAHIYLNTTSTVPCVGASGAIAAIMGAYIVMFPRSRIKMLFILFFRKFEIPAFVFLGIWFAQQLFSGVGDLSVNTADTAGVAWWAHIGGFVFGLLAGWLFRDKVRYSPKKKDIYA